VLLAAEARVGRPALQPAGIDDHLGSRRAVEHPPEGQPRPASLSDAVEEVWRFKQGMSDTLEVNGTRLLERIRALSPSQEAALVDALERMWARILTKGWDRIPVLLAEVGL
jgi:hypothetical protein